MNAASLLQQCTSNGLRIYIEDGRLQVEGDDELIDQYVPILTTHKIELLAYLEGMANSYVIQPTPPPPIAEYLAHREMMNLLSQFQMEKVVADVQTHVEAGYATEEIRRVNNVAWRLMATKGMAFDIAMEVAADWVAHNPEHPDEQNFTDVMTLYLGIGKDEDEPKAG